MVFCENCDFHKTVLPSAKIEDFFPFRFHSNIYTHMIFQGTRAKIKYIGTPSAGGWSLPLMVEDQELETAKTTMSEAKGFMQETTPTDPKLGAELINTDTVEKAAKAKAE